jgi:hypothetical protein
MHFSAAFWEGVLSVQMETEIEFGMNQATIECIFFSLEPCGCLFFVYGYQCIQSLLMDDHF